jgi:hypothetical protein
MEYTEEFIYKGKKISEQFPVNRWSMDNKRERVIHYEKFIATAYSVSEQSKENQDENKEDRFYKNDMFFIEDTVYSIELQSAKVEDIKKLPQLKSVFDPKRSIVHAEVFKEKTASFEYICPADWWLMFRKFVVTFDSVLEPQQTFEYFVNNKCKTTFPVRSKNNNGDTTWTFTLHPKQDTDKSFFEIVINENKGFFLERLSTHSFDGIKKTSTGIETEVELVVDFIVNEYTKIEEGRFFPKVFTYQYYPGGAKPEDCYQKTYHIKSISINKPIADSVFDFRIPEHSIVIYQPPIEKNGEKFFVEAIWGADNKPAITFTEPDGLQKYLEKLYKVAPQTGITSPRFVDYCWRIGCCTLGLVFIVISIFFMIRKNKVSK